MKYLTFLDIQSFRTDFNFVRLSVKRIVFDLPFNSVNIVSEVVLVTSSMEIFGLRLMSLRRDVTLLAGPSIDFLWNLSHLL